MKHKIVFMGTPDFAIPALEHIAKEHNVVAVYSQPPRPKGRGQEVQKSPVHLYAESLGIPIFTPANFKDSIAIEIFQQHAADFVVVVAYGLILPPAIFEAPKINTVNIHASLLPRWRGADPIRRAIMAGDDETGVAIMKVEKGLDTGGIYLEERTPIVSDDTGESLHDILSFLGAHLIMEYLNNYNNLEEKPQSLDGITYAHKLSKEDFKIDWQKPAYDIYNQVRALFPMGAFFQFEDDQIKIKKVTLLDEKTDLKPGTILSNDLKIACGNGTVLQLDILQRPGKKVMDRDDFLKGFSLFGTLK
ncbi:MAG: methionyl-tRNA formyltransferase [Alphaproteobacteria bacterium]|nr:methionyl-tRNA formyltransferase [Alphaproteobacteria bacterium]MBN2779847.1 methionyl-tRNA formyltransferase [Alphaproteobacteria bacterium]